MLSSGLNSKRSLKWLAKEAKLRIGYKFMKDCIFCKIAAGQMSNKLLYQSGQVVAFADINPIAETHLLIVPKKHIGSVAEIKKGDGAILEEMFQVGAKLAKDGGIDRYRLAFNGGEFQKVSHLHLHFLAGKKVEWEKL